jgi:RNA polymerase subunit RPABC4/transcription elongation factor Spt4
MEKKTYLEKLKDPRWQKKRLEILDRDEWTCQYCGSKDKTLHVHHLRYSGPDPWDCHSGFLITACEDCHKYESEVREEWERFLLISLKTIGLSAEDIFTFHYCLNDFYLERFPPERKKFLRELLKNFIESLREGGGDK